MLSYAILNPDQSHQIAKLSMPGYTEKDISCALEAIAKGVSQRKAAEAWGIPHATLHNRLNGVVPHKIAHKARQRLSQRQETLIKEWVIIQDSLGLPSTHQQIREFVSRVLIASGDIEPLGIHWIDGFFRHNPDIKSLRGKAFDK